jgi:LytS/YehU family sensor histidine kinase
VKWIEVILNVFFWILTGWAISSSFSIQGQEIEILNDIETVRTVRDPGMVYQLLICIGIAILMFYANLFNISRLSHSISKGKVLMFSAVILIVAMLLFLGIEQVIFQGYLKLPISLSMGIVLFYFTISSAYGFIKLWIQTEQKQKDLILAKKQAELNLLRNQLQPHFLFNSLNNLLSLVDQEKSPKLSVSIERLSLLLRHVIEETQNAKTTISKEINFIKNYCELQMLRFEEDEFKLQFEIVGEYDNQLLEPGLFIPFVENAIKYGTEPEIHSTLHITFDLTDKDIIDFTIKNKIIPQMRQKASTGTGINAVKERLALVYPNKYQIEIHEDEHFTVNLKISTN